MQKFVSSFRLAQVSELALNLTPLQQLEINIIDEEWCLLGCYTMWLL
jgi:hypothetical protein